MAVIAVGSELLGLDRLDTNSVRLTRVLNRYGAELETKVVVGDDVGLIADELRRLAGRVDLVVVSGGLGPTADDVTREAVCEAFGCTMRVEPAILEQIVARFSRHGLRMPMVNQKQAEVPKGARWVPNERGSAPGIVLERESCTICLLPGVPGEFDHLVESIVEPWLAERSEDRGIERAVVKVACLPESRVEERIAPAYPEFGRESITILARPGEIHLYASAAGTAAERSEHLSAMQRRLRELAGDAAFTDREEDGLETVVGGLLQTSGHTVSTAESCTGGLISERLTRVAGSSAYFAGGAVAYSNVSKIRDVGVAEGTVQSEGGVSEATARALAEGICERFGTDWGIGVTGIAGPGGGSDDKPVGTVHIAVAASSGDTSHRVRVFPGGRDRVRTQTAQWALDMLRRRLLVLPQLN
ncbi:MAG: CinA family nicotinamide mononucleotide deamidase-related protein [Acidobacteriota bacterium]|nr:CinA family nicotinamide mononucleotide deamidase-related protein [Acidobacteriota bacterium]